MILVFVRVLCVWIKIGLLIILFLFFFILVIFLICVWIFMFLCMMLIFLRRVIVIVVLCFVIVFIVALIKGIFKWMFLVRWDFKFIFLGKMLDFLGIINMSLKVKVFCKIFIFYF